MNPLSPVKATTTTTPPAVSATATAEATPSFPAMAQQQQPSPDRTPLVTLAPTLATATATTPPASKGGRHQRSSVSATSKTKETAKDSKDGQTSTNNHNSGSDNNNNNNNSSSGNSSAPRKEKKKDAADPKENQKELETTTSSTTPTPANSNSRKKQQQAAKEVKDAKASSTVALSSVPSSPVPGSDSGGTNKDSATKAATRGSVKKQKDPMPNASAAESTSPSTNNSKGLVGGAKDASSNSNSNNNGNSNSTNSASKTKNTLSAQKASSATPKADKAKDKDKDNASSKTNNTSNNASGRARRNTLSHTGTTAKDADREVKDIKEAKEAKDTKDSKQPRHSRRKNTDASHSTSSRTSSASPAPTASSAKGVHSAIASSSSESAVYTSPSTPRASSSSPSPHSPTTMTDSTTLGGGSPDLDKFSTSDSLPTSTRSTTSSRRRPLSTIMTRDINNNVVGSGTNSVAASPLPSPLVANPSPSSRRSSALGLGDKFARSGMLPTVDENGSVEKPLAGIAGSSSFGSLSSSSSSLASLGNISNSGSNNNLAGNNGQSSTTSMPGGVPAKRGHARSKSMKEQLEQFGQESNKEGTPKTIQSLQDIISSLKNLPPSTSAHGNNQQQHVNNNEHGVHPHSGGAGFGQGVDTLGPFAGPPSASTNARHEKRMSMSALPSRSMMGSLSMGAIGSIGANVGGNGALVGSAGSAGNNSTTTTLHISQPPKGTSIENALQATVSTLRRLSISSDAKRPVIGLKKDDESTDAARRANNRRSVVLPSEIAAAANNDTLDKKRNRRSAMVVPTDGPYYAGPSSNNQPTPLGPDASGAAGFKPSRRSVIIKPEEVAAMQEGRLYMPTSGPAGRLPAFSSSSDEETDGVADALSALEGKGTASKRTSMASNASSVHHRRSMSGVDPNSLAEFASKLPSHMQPGAGSAAFQNFGQSMVNNDDAGDRRRYTLQGGSGGSRSSMATAASQTANRRLSTLTSSKDLERTNWRMSTSSAAGGANHHSNRDSVNLKDNANGRRPLFMAHLTYSDFHSLLTKQKQKYVQGVLRINKRNRSDAYVTVDTLPEGDVYICGSKDRNRALEGDVVGIELLEMDEVHQAKLEGGKEKKKVRRTDELDDIGTAELDEIKPKYCGRVVSIVERPLVQLFSGSLTLQRPSGSAKKNERRRQDDEDHKGQPRIVWFKPTDKRVPLMAIPIDQAPENFVHDHSSYAHKLFVASIKRWPLSSLHPFGQLERELGDIGDIEIETEALLADNNVTTTAFGEKVEKCLPELPWSISEKDLVGRRDLRETCIFTIDPATAKDLDDAVSCVRLEDGNLEIGVHIADVSHFIRVGSALDREAKSRATTVYLVQKAIPMLPATLCEDLCSLNPLVDRLAFSVFWKMTDEGQVLDTSFSKSVIRSCAQLSYDDAQYVIDNGSLDPKVEIVGQERSLVEENIKMFYKLSQILRKKRFDNGALSINSIKLAFETDELYNPLDVSVYQIKDSNRLIEEFMLLANMSVAKQIADYLPKQALLRRHEGPLENRMADFISHMTKIGLQLDATSSFTLHESLEAIEDPNIRKVIRLLVIRPMQRAKYICAGMLDESKYHHYALNADLYTHFTSPIRRYADIIVHRMLEASLIGDQKFYLTKESCQKSANHCNIKKDAAKAAQEQSSHVYLSVLLRNLTAKSGPVLRDAIIVQVLDQSFDVLIPEYGLEKRIHLDQLPLNHHIWDSELETLQLYWSQDAFKQPAKNEEEENADGDEATSTTTGDDKTIVEDGHDLGGISRRLSVIYDESNNHHPDDATNAYDDERGLFDDDSDYDDDELVVVNKHHQENEKVELEGKDAERLMTIRMFGHLQVLVKADTSVSPPIISVVAMNPFAEERHADSEAAAATTDEA